MRHQIMYCGGCECYTIKCGICGNNCCNGGSGKSSGQHPSCNCNEAYALAKQLSGLDFSLIHDPILDRIEYILDDRFPANPLEKKFQLLTDIWRKETEYMSNLGTAVQHPAHRALIGLGKNIIPFIMRDLKKAPSHWFLTLRELLNDGPEIPEESRGKMKDLTRIWLDWLEKKGYHAQ